MNRVIIPRCARGLRLPPAMRRIKPTLIVSYHCSRYNINTGILTMEMSEKAMAKAKKATIQSV